MTTPPRPPQPPAAVAEALSASARRDVAGAHAALAGLESTARRAWSLAVDARGALLGAADAPAWELVEQSARTGTHPGATFVAAAALARHALLALDAASFARAVTLGRTVAHADEAGAATLEAWAALLDGRADDARAHADRVRPSAPADAALVVEAVIIRALAAHDAGDATEARASARRAARMAQADALPWPEMLAHLVLARVRRLLGAPHLAARILGALARVAPASWSRWIAWERAFAFGEADDLSSGDGPAATLRAMLAAANAGDRGGFDAARRHIFGAVRGWRALELEATALADAVDPRADVAAMRPELGAWCAGHTATAPAGIQGAVLGGDRGGLPSTGVAFVAAGAGLPPRRFLRPGLGLVAPEGAANVIAQTHRKQGRLDTAVATLALAGASGADPADFFRAVYGFAYVPELHKGVLDVLVHRTRERLAELATIDRAGARLVLSPQRLVVVPDPRCAPTVDDRILGLLAAKRAATARQAADSLGVPLRTIQTALSELVADGVLRAVGQGNRVEYAVEDTVFSDTTTSSLRR